MRTTYPYYASQSADEKQWPSALGWFPLAVLPAIVATTASTWPAWQLMCGLAISIYVGLKWLTFVDFVRHVAIARRNLLSAPRIAGYLLLWPGMDPSPFFAARPVVEPTPTGEWAAAVSKLIAGLVVVATATVLVENSRYAAGVLGIVGMLLALHFGLFHILALVWRRCGVAAKPIMYAPLLATSLGDFWSLRWNLAFRDLAHRFVFRPTLRKIGPAAATILVFLVSGAIHDIVISVPVRAGYGLPTLYFLIQGVGLLIERSKPARRIGIGRGAIGRAYCLAFALGPVALLFHRPFVEQTIAPMLLALQNLYGSTPSMNLETYIQLAGVLHFGILIASALVPKVLDWKASLSRLDPLSRQLVWVHGAFIVLTIVALGLLATCFAAELAGGGPLARGVCAFVAIFWGARLGVQFLVFDAKPLLTSAILRIGYRGLTIVFAYLTVVFALAALRPIP